MSALLPALPLLLLLGGAACALLARLGPQLARWAALLSLLLAGLLLAALGLSFELGALQSSAAPGFAWRWEMAWIPRLGISLQLGLDGLALLLCGLTLLLGLLAVLASWGEIHERVGLYHLCLLWHLAGVLGVFLALDLFLFFVCWEAMLVPMALLIALWGHRGLGGRSPAYAAIKFFLFTQASGLLMLAAFAGLAWQHWLATGSWSFDYFALRELVPDPAWGRWLMLGLFVAFAVKLPALGGHAWLPDAHSQAPTAGSIILAGVLLKTGAYGLLRFALPLFPQESAWLAPWAMALGVGGILYGASLALAQSDIKRFVAYTSISHMGFVLLGCYALQASALQGVVALLLAHGLATGALFWLCGALYARLHSRDLARMGGLAPRLPRLASAWVFFGLASLGLPGLGNFVGEILVLVGSFAVAPLAAVVAATGMVLAAVYGLRLISGVLHGPPRELGPADMADLRGAEVGGLLLLGLLLLALGLYPQPVFELADSAVTQALAARGAP